MTEARFILSAGRTGTVFLTHLLNTYCPDVFAEHEAPPSRSLHMLANFRNRTGLGNRLLMRLYAAAYRRRLQIGPEGKKYVSVNPMLCPLTDIVGATHQKLRIVHIVRDPQPWVKSIVNFRADSWRRPIIHLTPFAIPYPAPRPSGWPRLSRAEKAMWRWRYCNEQIFGLREQCESYAVIRHEDLYGSDREGGLLALQSLLDTLQIEAKADRAWLGAIRPMNVGPAGPMDRDRVIQTEIDRICRPVLDRLEAYHHGV